MVVTMRLAADMTLTIDYETEHNPMMLMVLPVLVSMFRMNQDLSMYNLLPLFYHLYVEVSVIWMEPVVVDSVTSVLVGEDDDLMVVVVGHMLMHLAECCDELVDVGVDDIVHHVKEAHMHLKVVAAVLVLDDLRCMVAVVEVMGNDVQLNVVVDMEHHVVHLKEDTDVEASMILVVTVEAVAAHNIDADTVVAVDRYPNMVAYLGMIASMVVVVAMESFHQPL